MSDSASPSPHKPSDTSAAPRFSGRGQNALWLICLLGFVLRAALQKERAFEGDELGSLQFIQESYGHLVTTFRDQLTMNYYLVLLKAVSQVLGTNPWVLVMPSILAGVATIWLMAKLALRITGERVALGTAFLIAVNPCLIEFSLRIRSYMFLVALSIGAILCFYDWTRERNWKHGTRCALWSLGALLMHPNALYQMTFLVVMLATELWNSRERALSFIVPMGLAALLTALAYLPIQADMAVFRERWTTSVPSEWAYLPDSMRLFFVGQAWILPSLGLFGMGVWVASQKSHVLAKLGLAILVPMVMTSFMGVSHYPWTYARFLMPILPVMLVFITRALTELAPRSNLLLALLIGGLCFSWWPRLEKAFREQRESPYQELAAHIEGLNLPNRSLYTFDPVVRGRLEPYLPRELFVDISKFVKASVKGEPASLHVITDKQLLVTEFNAKRIGRMRVYQFEGINKRALASKVFEAIGKALVDEPIAPPGLAVYYLELITMAQLFENSVLELEYTRLYYITDRYTKKNRQMPIQLRSPRMLND